MNPTHKTIAALSLIDLHVKNADGLGGALAGAGIGAVGGAGLTGGSYWLVAKLLNAMRAKAETEQIQRERDTLPGAAGRAGALIGGGLGGLEGAAIGGLMR